MRWFVEVSRVGESGLSEKYCVEARQWQAALQEARKLRGDTGGLSKFSIELLDDGYRAVDPSLKLRYLVNQAPGDAPLTPLDEDTDPSGVSSNGKSGKHRVAVTVPPTAFAPFIPPEPTAKPGVSVIPRPTSHGPRSTSNAVPRPASLVAPRPASSMPPRVQPLAVPDDPVPPAPRTPVGLGTPSELEPVVPLLPHFEVVRARAEEPRPDSPITYREIAYAVQPGTPRAQIEALLWARYQDVAAAIEQSPAGKFVQLAVFDHSFQTRPERPPLATFAWKDWRGGPVLTFPGFGDPLPGPLSQVPPPQASIPPGAGAQGASQAPPKASTFPPLVVLADPVATAAQASGSLPAEAPIAAFPLTPAESTLVGAAPAEPAPVAAVAPEPPVPAVAPLVPVPVAAEMLVAVESTALPAVPVVSPALPVAAAPVAAAPVAAEPVAASRSSSPDVARQSRPRLGVSGRRRAGEDLIAELFDVMHELHFMRDVAAGAEFVLGVLNEVLPCEGVLIHVFDINTNHFVVVRAKGPKAKSVLLQRMRDQDPLALSVMRSVQAVAFEDVSSDPRFNGLRWEAVGVAPKRALCGPVRQGGRYLGLIELVNPAGDTPFHRSELNALDYICEQFAEFLSNRPIIVAADVVLAGN